MTNVISIHDRKMKEHDELAAACGIVREYCDVTYSCEACGHTEDVDGVSGYTLDAYDEAAEEGLEPLGCPKCESEAVRIKIREKRFITPGTEPRT